MGGAQVQRPRPDVVLHGEETESDERECIQIDVYARHSSLNALSSTRSSCSAASPNCPAGSVPCSAPGRRLAMPASFIAAWASTFTATCANVSSRPRLAQPVASSQSVVVQRRITTSTIGSLPWGS
jgi:hypothetical protein